MVPSASEGFSELWLFCVAVGVCKWSLGKGSSLRGIVQQSEGVLKELLLLMLISFSRDIFFPFSCIRIPSWAPVKVFMFLSDFQEGLADFLVSVA